MTVARRCSGHRHPHRWPGHQRGSRPEARERRARPARQGPQGRRHQGRDDHRRGCAATPSRSPVASTRSAPRSRRATPTTTSEKLQERLAKLAGGVAVIKAGAATEVELKERKHRIEDAVRNAKAAVEEGIVAGGGVALLQAGRTAFEKLDLEGDEATGAHIVEIALEAPLKQIAINAGLEGGVVVEKVRNLEPGRGLNAATGEYVDMIKAGIIDPAKVTRSALQNAASIAALFLTTEAVIADKPEKNPARLRVAAAAGTWTSKSDFSQFKQLSSERAASGKPGAALLRSRLCPRRTACAFTPWDGRKCTGCRPEASKGSSRSDVAEAGGDLALGFGVAGAGLAEQLADATEGIAQTLGGLLPLRPERLEPLLCDTGPVAAERRQRTGQGTQLALDACGAGADPRRQTCQLLWCNPDAAHADLLIASGAPIARLGTKSRSDVDVLAFVVHSPADRRKQVAAGPAGPRRLKAPPTMGERCRDNRRCRRDGVDLRDAHGAGHDDCATVRPSRAH